MRFRDIGDLDILLFVPKRMTRVTQPYKRIRALTNGGVRQLVIHRIDMKVQYPDTVALERIGL